MTVSILSIFFCIAAVAIAVISANYLSAYLINNKIPISVTKTDDVKKTKGILFLIFLICAFLIETVCYFFICKPETAILPAPAHPIISPSAPLAIEIPQGRLTEESNRQERHTLLLEEEKQLVRARFEHWPLATLPVLSEQKSEQVVVRPPFPPLQQKPNKVSKNRKNFPDPLRGNEQNNTLRQRFTDVKRYILSKMDVGDRQALSDAMNMKNDNQHWTSQTTGIYYQVNTIKKYGGYCQGYVVLAVINGWKYSYREPASSCR
ncbi:hypothetical protein [Candidatus Electronema sp. TJ]|uniref:hypothetical protein n=1 Tax=Candidatus Electronema sp. TJ TaxID=3401573 RepID=UPI003AA81A59